MSERPKPPAGFATWLDYVADINESPPLFACAMASDELAELRAKVDLWTCTTCGAMFPRRPPVGTMQADPQEGVTRCSKCVQAKVLDALVGKLREHVRLLREVGREASKVANAHEPSPLMNALADASEGGALG